MRRPILRVVCAVMLSAQMIVLAGCAEGPPKLEAKVTSPLGRPGVCAHCNHKIDEVAQDNLVTADGVQYVVCDEQCAADLKKWLAEQ